jgi:hypothetical protein
MQSSNNSEEDTAYIFTGEVLRQAMLSLLPVSCCFLALSYSSTVKMDRTTRHYIPEDSPIWKPQDKHLSCSFIYLFIVISLLYLFCLRKNTNLQMVIRAVSRRTEYIRWPTVFYSNFCLKLICMQSSDNIQQNTRYFFKVVNTYYSIYGNS